MHCTAASGQRSMTDIAGGHSGWQHYGWYNILLTDSAYTNAKDFIAKLNSSAENISTFALLIA